MSQTAIQDILDRIKRLSAHDRLLFDEMLAHEEDREWREAARSARGQTREKGLDHKAIDRAVLAIRRPRP